MSGKQRRIAITGYGMITPSGRNAEETFRNCVAGRSGIDYIKSFDTTGLPCRIAGEVDDAWIEDGDRPGTERLSKYSSRSVRLMAAATGEERDPAALARSRASGNSLAEYRKTMDAEEKK